MILKALGRDDPDSGNNTIGMKTTRKIGSHHLFEIKNGCLVKMPRSPMDKKKIDIIPNMIGISIDTIIL